MCIEAKIMLIIFYIVRIYALKKDTCFYFYDDYFCLNYKRKKNFNFLENFFFSKLRFQNSKIKKE